MYSSLVETVSFIMIDFKATEIAVLLAFLYTRLSQNNVSINDVLPTYRIQKSIYLNSMSFKILQKLADNSSQEYWKKDG